MKKFYQLIVAVLLLTVAATASAQESPIFTLPEGGTTKLYHRAGGAYYAVLGNQTANLEYDYLPCEIVEYENGDVYIKDFFSQYDYSYYGEHPYIKGHKEGSTITFDMPQLMSIRTYYGETDYFYVSMVEYSALKRTFVPVAADKNKYVINVKEDGVLEAPLVNDGLIFPGKIDKANDWVYEGEVYTTWTPMTYTEITAPEGLECVSMSLLDVNGFGRYVNVGFDNNDVYIKGVFDMTPEKWIKGTRSGDKISFASGQYMGFSPSGMFLSFFTAAQFETEYDPEEKEDVRVLKFRDAITFDYDEAAKKLTAPEGWLMVYNKNPEHINYMEYIEAPVIENIPENISKQVSDPWNLDRHLPTSADDLEYISFCISALNVDGKLLDPTKLYYRIYYNGQPYTFLPGQYTYPGLDGPTQFIPFNFENGGSFSMMDALRLIYVYEDKINIETVGVQLYYIEGEPNEENIVTRSKLVTYPQVASNMPMTPENVSFIKAEKAWEYSEMSFDIKAQDENGNDLSSDNLYYLIYFDNNEEPFTFVRDSKYNYWYIETPVTYIPFAYYDYEQDKTAGDFKVIGDRRKITVYDRTVEKAGVRLCYIEGEPKAENVKAQTNIIYPSTSSIEGAVVLKTIDSTVYYNLAGCQVAEPADGVFIKVVKYSDGTTETIKVKK